MNLRAATIYVWGNTLAGFSNGLYIAGIGVFLLFLQHNFPESKHPDLALQFLILLALVDFIFDVITAVCAEFLNRFSRRLLFNAGFFFQGCAFLFFALFAYKLQAEAMSPWMLVGASVCKDLGDTLIAGKFDSWAIGLEIESNPTFSREMMFSRAQFGQRALLFLGAIFAMLALFKQDTLVQLERKLDAVGVWSWFWAVAATYHFALFLAVLNASRKLPSEKTLKSSDPKPDFIKMLKSAVAREAWPAWVLLTSLYTLAVVITFLWPVLLGGGRVRYFTLPPQSPCSADWARGLPFAALGR